MNLITGRAHIELAKNIAKKLSVKLINANITSFPDGETFVKINDNIRGQDVFIIQPTSPPTNDNLMELLIMVDAAKRASAKRITAVIPYFGYARQDRKSEPRVPITAKLVADLLQVAGVSRVLTVDLHAGQIQGFFDIPVDHLYSAPVILEYIKEKKMNNLMVATPDVGGIKAAYAYASELNVDMAIIAKRRLSATKVSATDLIGNVKGCDVLIVDDLTESGGTIIAAANMLKEAGANDIYAGVTHGMLSDLGRERLNKSIIKELICTNSTPQATVPDNKVKCLSIANLLAEAIHRIHNNESVSSLFTVK